MKKTLTIIALLALTISACTPKPEEVEEPTPVEEQEEQPEAVETKTYTSDLGVSFEYPAEWTYDGAPDNFFYDENDFRVLQHFTGDVLGGRCAVKEKDYSYTDAQGRQWNRPIEIWGNPYEPDNELCGYEIPVEEQDERSLYLSLTPESTPEDYKGILFYTYLDQNEEMALSQLEGILDTLTLE